ncbi:MAG: osmotically inducible protein OsmC [Actinobacteria bacterium RBG_16_64_13]|nr:MAG: osmotically inducible protein OsmC [Actinobacteria bacterium RBG_16_64_13]
MDMEVYFPGNKKVYANYKGFVIQTDQPLQSGGDESAPAPFDLFMVSIGTCAGIYVLNFLEQRGLPTQGAGITLRQERDPETKLVGKVSLEIKLPAGFPEKYRDAVIRAAETCAVKRHLDNPPAFETYATIG